MAQGMTMDQAFARRLIEQPGEETTRALFEGSYKAGIFWVDWREGHDDIVALARRALEAALGPTALAAAWAGSNLRIDFRGRQAEAALQGKPGEQDSTLEALNQALQPDFELRHVKASEGGDGAAFMILETGDWHGLEAAWGAKLDAAFARLDRSAPIFGSDMPPEEMQRLASEAAASLRFASAAPPGATPQLLTRDQAMALRRSPSRAGNAMPVIDPAFGDLMLAYLREGRHVTVGELGEHGVAPSPLQEQTLADSRAAWEEMPFDESAGLGRVIGKYAIPASTYALYGGYWNAWHRERGPIVAAIPHQDIMLFAMADDADGIAILCEAIAFTDPRDPGALSRKLYTWGDDTWNVYDPGPAAGAFRSSEEWLAAERGEYAAQYGVAYRYHAMGHYAEAARRYLKAAPQVLAAPGKSGDMYENGSAILCNLANAYEHSLGLPQDLAKAFHWYRKSAAMNNRVAQYDLGMMYLRGRGAPRDLELARNWLTRSAGQGYDDAREALQGLQDRE
jgi:hypothetical protein